MTLPKKVEYGSGTHVKNVKKREGCETEVYGGCQYLALFNDCSNKIIALGTCYHHSGLEQHTQDSHPDYYKEIKYPCL